LNAATVAAYLLLLDLARLSGKGYSRPIFDVLLIAGFVAVFASVKYAPRYYRWRFGFIEERVAPPDWSLKSVLGILVWVWVFSVAVVGGGFSHLEPKGIDLEPLILLTALLVYMSLSRPTLMSVRLPYLIPALLAVAGVTLFPLWYIADHSQLVLWSGLNRGLIPFFIFVMGLGDHIMLLRLMPKRVALDEEGDRDDK
jgi:hypothetical protein